MMRVWVSVIGLLRLIVTEAVIPYTLLPRESDYCQRYLKDYSRGQGIAVAQQIQLQTGLQDVNASSMYRAEVCEPEFFPLGKIVQWNLEGSGVMKFWYLRVHIDGHFSDCKHKLVVTEKHSSRHVDDHETPLIKHEYSCDSSLPIVLQAIYRNMQFRWEGPADTAKSSVTVSISKYVQFSLNASSHVRRTRCLNAQDLFFCNATEVCIPGVSHCDGNDDCFDSGSDELGCGTSNRTRPTKPKDHTHGSWMTNLPWIALGILPVILVFALARICSQKRHLDIGEDYKMGFNTEDEEEGEEGTAATGPGGARSERSVSPDDAESGRNGHDDYADEGYSLPRHKKTMSASSDYLPANFVELTASPANRARRAENERSSAPPPFGPGTPTKTSDGGMTPQQPAPPPQQQQVVAVQINNPVYGNNVYVDVPTHTAKKDAEYTRPVKPVVAPVSKPTMRNGQEEYTPLLPPLPPGAAGVDGGVGENPGPSFPPSSGAGLCEGGHQRGSSGTSDDYEDEPPPYDDLMTPPPPVAQPSKGSGGDGDRPEMLHLKPLLRPSGATASGGGASPKAPAPPAPNGSTSAERNNRDSDYDKNYIVV